LNPASAWVTVMVMWHAANGGWQWCPEPIEWIEQVPPDALRNGEGVNLWRHHILCLADGRLALFYNSGPYGKEQLYMKVGSIQ